MQRPEDEVDGAATGTEGDVEALHVKASALVQEGKIPEAEVVYRTIVRQVKARLGKDHPGYAAALYELSRVLSGQSKHAEAEGLLRRALDVFEEAPGASHPPYAQTLQTLAGALGAQDKFKEAEEALRAGLAAQEKVLGAEDERIGPTLTNLAIALVQQQRLQEAEPLIARSLALAEVHHGEAHEETARILTIMAQVQAALGKEEASGTARRALTSLVATHGAEHPLVQDVEPILKDIAEPSAELDAALQEGAEALEARDADRAIALLGPLVERARKDGLLPLEASASGMLAQALFVTGKKGDALALAHRALAIAEEAGQEDASRHFRDLVDVMERNEGSAGLTAGLHDQIQAAIETAQKGDIASAVRSLETVAGEAQASRDGGAEATVRIVIGQILQAAHDREAAAVHLRRAIAIAEEIGDKDAADHVRRMLEPG